MRVTLLIETIEAPTHINSVRKNKPITSDAGRMIAVVPVKLAWETSRLTPMPMTGALFPTDGDGTER